MLRMYRENRVRAMWKLQYKDAGAGWRTAVVGSAATLFPLMREMRADGYRVRIR